MMIIFFSFFVSSFISSPPHLQSKIPAFSNASHICSRHAKAPLEHNCFANGLWFVQRREVVKMLLKMSGCGGEEEEEEEEQGWERLMVRSRRQ